MKSIVFLINCTTTVNKEQQDKKSKSKFLIADIIDFSVHPFL